MTDNELKTKWEKDIGPLLVGRKIKNVRYMTDAEVKHLDWVNSAIVITLDNGVVLYPSCDDELNNAGSIATTDDDVPVIPVI